MVVGEKTSLIVGIINNERKVVSYRVEVRVDDEKKNEVGPVVLEHDEQWEGEVGFVLEKVKDNQRVEFLLYKNDGSEAYLTLHLWVDVIQ